MMSEFFSIKSLSFAFLSAITFFSKFFFHKIYPFVYIWYNIEDIINILNINFSIVSYCKSTNLGNSNKKDKLSYNSNSLFKRRCRRYVKKEIGNRISKSRCRNNNMYYFSPSFLVKRCIYIEKFI